MNKPKTVYTELLEAAMRVAYEQERYAVDEVNRKAWADLNRKCRKELYAAKKVIEPLKKEENNA